MSNISITHIWPCHSPWRKSLSSHHPIGLSVLIWSLLMIVSSPFVILQRYQPLYIEVFYFLTCKLHFASKLILSESQGVYHDSIVVPSPANLILNGWCTDNVLKLRKYNALHLQHHAFSYLYSFPVAVLPAENTSTSPFPLISLLTPFHFSGFCLIGNSNWRSLSWFIKGWVR